MRSRQGGIARDRDRPKGTPGRATPGCPQESSTMKPPLPKIVGRMRLRGRRCVRCGTKLEGYRRIFCGAECKRGDDRERKRLKRARGRSEGKCMLCGRRFTTREAGVSRDTGPSSHDRRGGGGGCGTGASSRPGPSRQPSLRELGAEDFHRKRSGCGAMPALSWKRKKPAPFQR